MDSENILDKVHREIKRQVWFDSEHKYAVGCVWPVATRFLWKGIKGFKSFPYIAFMSPEPDSGKTRALDVVGSLSYNPMKRGKYTPAVFLRYIDREWSKKDTYTTSRQDEIDNVFVHGRDNSDLIQFYNLGNEEGGIVARCDLNSDEILETKAFCPKAFAGLKAAKLPDPTKTRTIIISMKPATLEHELPEDPDEVPLAALSLEIDKWAAEHDLSAISLPEADIAFLVNRNRQIWRPLLILSKAVSDIWYEKALAAARYFTQGIQDADKGISHKILRGAFKVYLSKLYHDRIHSFKLLAELHEQGIPEWVKEAHLADYLFGYEIHKPTQVKIDGVNRNGYHWHFFERAFDQYILGPERQQIEDEINNVNDRVDPVDPVDHSGGIKPVFDSPRLTLPIGSTASTSSTFYTSEGVSTIQHTLTSPPYNF
jgi:Protein of unknown function (DUF3631)